MDPLNWIFMVTLNHFSVKQQVKLLFRRISPIIFISTPRETDVE